VRDEQALLLLERAQPLHEACKPLVAREPPADGGDAVGHAFEHEHARRRPGRSGAEGRSARAAEGFEQHVLGDAEEPAAEGGVERGDLLALAPRAAPDLLHHVARLDQRAHLRPDAQLGPRVQGRRQLLVTALEVGFRAGRVALVEHAPSDASPIQRRRAQQP
jgi:hypothetical protein